MTKSAIKELKTIVKIYSVTQKELAFIETLKKLTAEGKIKWQWQSSELLSYKLNNDDSISLKLYKMYAYKNGGDCVIHFDVSKSALYLIPVSICGLSLIEMIYSEKNNPVEYLLLSELFDIAAEGCNLKSLNSDKLHIPSYDDKIDFVLNLLPK